MRNWLTTEMRDRLGYDYMGNAPHLVAEIDRIRIDNGDWVRADGNVVCECGVLYRLHPLVQGALWLVRTCSGLIVKL